MSLGWASLYGFGVLKWGSEGVLGTWSIRVEYGFFFGIRDEYQLGVVWLCYRYRTVGVNVDLSVPTPGAVWAQPVVLPFSDAASACQLLTGRFRSVATGGRCQRVVQRL